MKGHPVESVTPSTKFDPHCAGAAECLECEKRWYAVWPLGAEALECPRCESRNTDREAIDRDSDGHAVRFRSEYMA